MVPRGGIEPPTLRFSVGYQATEIKCLGAKYASNRSLSQKGNSGFCLTLSALPFLVLGGANG